MNRRSFLGLLGLSIGAGLAKPVAAKPIPKVCHYCGGQRVHLQRYRPDRWYCDYGCLGAEIDDRNGVQGNLCSLAMRRGAK